MKTITISVSPEADVEVAGAGFVGKECDKVMAAMEEALGKVKSTKKLPAWYQQQVGQQKVGGS